VRWGDKIELGERGFFGVVRVEFEGVDMWAVLIPTLAALVVVRNPACNDAGVAWWGRTVWRGVEVCWSSCGCGIVPKPRASSPSSLHTMNIT
jgi:hypothetical protein